jgi:Domain of unknown function (DUF6293)/DUF6293 C-terminal winged helix domain
VLRKLRVHIAPYGYETRRVYYPLIHLDADKVYLIGYEANDSAKKYHEEIRRELAKHPRIQVSEDSVDMWDLYACIEKFRSITLKESGNHVYVNVSTGSKITAMAGLLSCMISNGIAQPYYVHASGYRVVEEPKQGDQKIDSLPVYAMKKPKSEELEVLKTLDENRGGLRKWRLIEILEEKDIIKQKPGTSRRVQPKEFTLAAKHSQLRVILGPMESLEYIQIKGSGKRGEVSITDQGKGALRIFGT